VTAPPWSARRERAAIVQHVARWRFCAALLSHGASRQDRELLTAAELLLAEHVTDDEERITLVRGRRR
jgi:hypothetical protein